MISLKKDSKGPCLVLSHRRCGITETLFLSEEEVLELARIIIEDYGIEGIYSCVRDI